MSFVGDPIYGVCDGARKSDFVALSGSPERWLGVGELRNSCDGEEGEGRRGGERREEGRNKEREVRTDEEGGEGGELSTGY